MTLRKTKSSSKRHVLLLALAVKLIQISRKEEPNMSNVDFLRKLKKTECYEEYLEYLGEHGHGHYHSITERA